MAALPRIGACGTSPGGKLSIEASLDVSSVAPGAFATLTVQVRSAGLNLPEVRLPPLTVDVERPNQPIRRTPVITEHAGTSQSFSMVNNAVERSATTVYRILPQSEGTIHIPPLRVSVGKETAQSSPLTLIVSRTAVSPGKAPSGAITGPANAPSGRPEIFVQASVDRSRVFWNQQLLLRLRLYSRVDILGDVDWKPPPTTGFWTEGLGPARHGRVTVRGVPYEVMEIPTALFPTKTGTLTIGSAQVRVRVARIIQPPDPWSMLAMPEVVPQDLALTSNPVTVVVDPLPPGAPSGFQGAVGDYRLALHVDSLTVRAGDPVTVRATIRGTGNIATVRDPEIRARGATRQYVVGSSTKVDRSGDRLQGERETDVAFIADQPGALTVLPVAFVWFDPEGGRYRSQRSESVRVTVLPGTGAPAQAGRVGPGSAAVAALRRKPGPFGALSPDPPAASVALLGLSAIAYAGALAVAGARRKRLRDPRVARLDVLESLLTQDLSRAGSLASRNEPARAAAIAEQALLRGVGIRYDVDLAGLARPERTKTLRSRGADEADVSAVESLLDSLGAIAYAPPETRVEDAREAIRAVRERIERYRRELLS
jgi:hypothetical protein